MFSNMADRSNNGHMNSSENTNEIQSARPVLPCFMFTSETGRIDGYALSRFVSETAGESGLKCIQETKNLWRIYCHTHEAKASLISQGISLNGKWIKVYNQNPYVTGALNQGLINPGEPEVDMIKVTIKDLYCSVSNDDVLHLFTNIFKIKVTSDIQIGYYRDSRGGLTSLENGDRILWIHPNELVHPLPRNAFCGTRPCRIFHRDQFKDEGHCYNCFQKDHKSRNCPNEKCCMVCKRPGHDPGSPDCPHYIAKQKVRTIGGKGDPLSNHYDCPFEHNHVMAKTSENHWFFQKGNKNGQPELANLCLDAKDAKKAKKLSKSILCADTWDYEIGYQIMKDILRSKLTQVKAARSSLREAWEDGLILVESVPNPRDLCWGSSLGHEATAHTLPEYWPGQNNLGKILQELAVEFWGENEWQEGTPGVAKGLEDTQILDSSEQTSERNVEAATTAAIASHESSTDVSSDTLESTESKVPENPGPVQTHAHIDPTGDAKVEVSSAGALGDEGGNSPKKPSLASKLAGLANLGHHKSRSKSPKSKKKGRPTSPRTPSRKRGQDGMHDSQASKIAKQIDVNSSITQNVKMNEGSRNQKKFKNGSGKNS